MSSCRQHVPARDATAERRRHRGVLPGARPQRARRERGAKKAQIVHNFGRADLVDREALKRLVRSISRLLDPVDALTATLSREMKLLDSRSMGSAWVADQLWRRLGIDKAIAQVASRRRMDACLVERVIFAMVANRLSVKPLSKLAGCTWLARRVYIEGLETVSDDACHRAMDSGQ